MSTTTSNFGLFKYDTTNDASTAFSITNALNNNWDKLDANCVKRLSTSAATGNTVRPVYVDSSGQIQSCSYNIPTSTGLTATTSLSENGYIKFSNSLCLQWGMYIQTPSAMEIFYPINFSQNVFGIYCQTSVPSSLNIGIVEEIMEGTITLSSFTSWSMNQAPRVYYHAIGN